MHGLSVGDRVVYVSRFAGQADMVCVPTERIYKMPASMSFEEAAALPVNYLTAFHMLFRVTRIAPGDHVLIHMAAGGVGTALLQLCQTVPDVTTYGTCSAAKHDYARSQGLQHAIDYQTQDYVQEIRQAHRRVAAWISSTTPWEDGTGRKDYSVLKQAARWWPSDRQCQQRGASRHPALAQGARSSPILTPIKLMNDNKGYAGVNMGRLFGETDVLREAMMRCLPSTRRARSSRRSSTPSPSRRSRKRLPASSSGATAAKYCCGPTPFS